ncbi:MAG: tetratricopeptide repeat protein [Bacteroidales bacterium]
MSLIFLVLFTGVKANTDELFSRAGEMYKAGEYAEAVALYDSIYSLHLESAELCFNLGNAWFKLKEIPKAVLWYERAYRLSPSDGDIRYNLEMARSMVVDKLEVIPDFFLTDFIKGIRGHLNSDSWAWRGLTLLVVGLGLALIFLFSSRMILRKIALTLALLALIISVLSISFSLKQKRMMEGKTSAIIMTPSVTLKSSPDQNGNDLFILHEGTKVEIDDKLGEWLEIRISDGNKGWIESSALEII